MTTKELRRKINHIFDLTKEHKTLTRQKQAMVSCKLHDLYVDQRMLDAVTKRIDDIESLLYDMLK